MNNKKKTFSLGIIQLKRERPEKTCITFFSLSLSFTEAWTLNSDLMKFINKSKEYPFILKSPSVFKTEKDTFWVTKVTFQLFGSLSVSKLK